MSATGRKFRPTRWLQPLFAAVAMIYVVMTLPPEELLSYAVALSKIIAGTGFMCFAGSVLEYRSWLRFAAAVAMPLMRFSRLPRVCAAAFAGAFVSGSAAGMILAASRRDGHISRREMICGALCNYTPAMISFSLGAMLSVIVVTGTAGIIYYGITYGISLIMLAGILLFSRFTAAPACGIGREDDCPAPPCYEWRVVLVKSLRRTALLLRRVLMITVPLYMLTSCAVRQGFFRIGASVIPAWLESWFTPESMTILASRMGGMLSASGIAAELLRQNRVSVIQVVFVFVLGNVINNPFRVMRRSLPVAMGIYPGGDGALIVAAQMSVRLLLNTAAVAVIVWIFG